MHDDRARQLLRRAGLRDLGVAIALNTTLSATTPFIAGWLYDRGFGYASSSTPPPPRCFLAVASAPAMRRPARDEHAG
ncbi:MAG: hypothetical protein U1F06_02095 [Steroidobacteraceae bacterium]